MAKLRLAVAEMDVENPEDAGKMLRSMRDALYDEAPPKVIDLPKQQQLASPRIGRAPALAGDNSIRGCILEIAEEKSKNLVDDEFGKKVPRGVTKMELGKLTVYESIQISQACAKLCTDGRLKRRESANGTVYFYVPQGSN